MAKSQPESAAKEFGEETFSFAADFMKRLATSEQDWIGRSVQVWSDEMRRQIEEMTADNARALHQLASCKTALDVVKVEQEWIMARSKVWFESGMRMSKLFAEATKTVTQAPIPGGQGR